MAVRLGGGGGGGMAEAKIMAKVKYDFSTNEGRKTCNTSFSPNFDWKIHFLYYFHDSRSSSMSKGQSKGQISENMIFTKYS